MLETETLSVDFLISAEMELHEGLKSRQSNCICDQLCLRWMCHAFMALKDSGERLSHAVGCAFAICLERKQRRDKECAVEMQFCNQENTFTRFSHLSCQIKLFSTSGLDLSSKEVYRKDWPTRRDSDRPTTLSLPPRLQSRTQARSLVLVPPT